MDALNSPADAIYRGLVHMRPNGQAEAFGGNVISNGQRIAVAFVEVSVGFVGVHRWVVILAVSTLLSH